VRAALQVHDATLSLQQAQAAAAEALAEKAEKPGRSKSKATRAIADGASDARLALLQEEARRCAPAACCATLWASACHSGARSFGPSRIKWVRCAHHCARRSRM
jgi:hypothetical protein